MGQLTNLYVSESYQGLLKLANSTTGVTGTLQYVQDGIGNNIPMLVSTSSVVITGSFRGDGSGLTGITVDSGSLVTTSSFNAFTASIDGRVDALEVATGSLQNQINQKLDTGSFNSYTSSNDAKVNALINATGSYATTSSLTSLSQSIATTDLSQNNRLTSIEGVTGSFATTSSLNSYTLTSSFNSYTSSANGRLSSLESATSSLQNQINQKLDTGSFNTYTSSNDAKVNSLISKTGSYATTGSNTFIGTQTINGQLQVSDIVPSVGSDISIVGSNVNLTGSLNVTGQITALSASITYLQTIYQTSSVVFSSGSNILGDASNDTQTLFGTVRLPNGPLSITGSATASSGFFGNLQGTASFATNALSASWAPDTTNTSSFMITGSVSGPTSTFTKGDGSQFSLTVNNVQSASFAQTSISSSFSNFAVSSSQAQNAVSASQAANSVLLNGTGSGVFATTGSNTFNGNQLINGIVIIDASNTTFNQALNAFSGSQGIQMFFPTFGGDTQPTIYFTGKNSYFQATDNFYIENSPGGSGTGSIFFVTNGDLNYTTNGTGRTINLNNAKGNIIASGSQFQVKANNGINISNPADGTSYYNVQIETGSFKKIAMNMFAEKSFIQGYGELNFLNTWDANSSGSINFYSPNQVNFFATSSVQISGSNNVDIKSSTISATGSLRVSGSQHIVRGNVDISGSLSVFGNDLDLISSNTTVNPNAYLTNSLVGQSNIIQGWGDNPGGGAQASQANYTGSLRITGSNNIVSMPQVRATGLGGNAGQEGYISGSGNMIMANNSAIFLNTGSLLFPKTQNNILGNGSVINLNFTTSSLSGGHPLFANNLLMGGGLNLNHPSGSVNASGNALMAGSIASTQTFVTNVRPTISANNIVGAVTINHISGSVNFQNNYVNAGTFTINNHVSSSNITNNGVSVTNNVVFGGSGGAGISIYTSGSQNSNSTRLITDSIIGGRNVTVSSSFVSSSNSSLLSSLIVGNGLTVSGSHTAGTNGGSAFLGRFNDTGSLALAQDIVFAVGTGTAAATRRTGLYITSGSLVGVSGSLDVKGGDIWLSGSLYVTGAAQFLVQNLNVGVSAGDEGGEILLAKAATNTTLTGSGVTVDVYRDRLRIFEQAGTNRGGYFAINEMAASAGSKLGPLNAGEFWSNTTQSGSAGVSGSINFDNSGSVAGVSLVSNSRLTVADAGTYNIQFSAQVETSAGSDTAYVWFKKNGTNIADSATKVALANNTAQVMTVNILDTAVANDYYELAYQFTNGNATILSEAASGNVPRIPSVIATVTQIR